MPRRKGQVRFGYRNLSTPYRTRLERQGITQRQWEDGVSLQAARGHATYKAPGGAPREATLRIAVGQGTQVDERELARWRRSNLAPSWIPKNRQVMQDDVAAALSLIGSAPRNWKTVDIKKNDDGTYSVLVTTKRGAKRATVLPDYEAVRQFGDLLRNRDGQGRTAKEKRDLRNAWTKANGSAWEIEVKMNLGYDTESMKPTPEPVKKTTGKALPKKRK
jgi:hypothetical protein